MLTFGPFPATSLSNARVKREEARSILASGMNPSVKRKLDKIAAATAARNTFGDVAAEHLNNMEVNGTATTTMKKNRWICWSSPTASILEFIFNAHRIVEGELYLVRDPLEVLKAFEAGVENVGCISYRHHAAASRNASSDDG